MLENAVAQLETSDELSEDFGNLESEDEPECYQMEASDEVWNLEVDLAWTGYVIFSSGEEATSDSSTTLSFSYKNEQDAKDAEAAAKSFGSTTGTKLTKGSGKGYPMFKKDLFIKILADVVDPKVNKTIKAYRRGSGRRRRY